MESGNSIVMATQGDYHLTGPITASERGQIDQLLHHRIDWDVKRLYNSLVPLKRNQHYSVSTQLFFQLMCQPLLVYVSAACISLA